MNHPLTDDIIHSMWGKGDPSQKFEYRLARASADWQLEECIKEVNQMLYVFELAGKIDEVERMGLLNVFKNAMRPQENS